MCNLNKLDTSLKLRLDACGTLCAGRTLPGFLTSRLAAYMSLAAGQTGGLVTPGRSMCHQSLVLHMLALVWSQTLGLSLGTQRSLSRVCDSRESLLPMSAVADS